MLKKWIVVAFAFVLVIFGFSLRSVAGCKSDCREALESETESCKETYNDPGEADMLRMCFDNAYSEYQSCYDECEN